MEFWSLRRAERRARKADRAMRSAFGHSWDVHRDAIHDLLTATAPLYAVDANALDAAVRRIVADELASGSAAAEEQGLGESFEDEALAEEPNVPLQNLFEPTSTPAAEVDEPSPLKDAIFEERNGVAAVPVRPDLNDDGRRRAFIANFLKEQRVPVTSNQPMRS